MTDLHFTTFDYIVVAILVFSCVFAYVRGLVREILSLAAWVGAGIVSIYYFQTAAENLQRHFKSPVVAAAIAIGGVYLLALIAFTLLNMLIIKSIKSGKDDGVLDNMLGLAFGAARGGLIVSLILFMIMVAIPDKKEYPDWLKGSVTRPYVEKGAELLARVAPNYLFELAALERKEEGKPLPEKPITPDTDNSDKTDKPEKAEASEDTGYNRSTTRQLDRLIEGNQ